MQFSGGFEMDWRINHFQQCVAWGVVQNERVRIIKWTTKDRFRIAQTWEKPKNAQHTPASIILAHALQSLSYVSLSTPSVSSSTHLLIPNITSSQYECGESGWQSSYRPLPRASGTLIEKHTWRERTRVFTSHTKPQYLPWSGQSNLHVPAFETRVPRAQRIPHVNCLTLRQRQRPRQRMGKPKRPQWGVAVYDRKAGRTLFGRSAMKRD